MSPRDTYTVNIRLWQLIVGVLTFFIATFLGLSEVVGPKVMQIQQNTSDIRSQGEDLEDTKDAIKELRPDILELQLNMARMMEQQNMRYTKLLREGR